MSWKNGGEIFKSPRWLTWCPGCQLSLPREAFTREGEGMGLCDECLDILDDLDKTMGIVEPLKGE